MGRSRSWKSCGLNHWPSCENSFCGKSPRLGTDGARPLAALPDLRSRRKFVAAFDSVLVAEGNGSPPHTSAQSPGGSAPAHGPIHSRRRFAPHTVARTLSCAKEAGWDEARATDQPRRNPCPGGLPVHQVLHRGHDLADQALRPLLPSWAAFVFTSSAAPTTRAQSGWFSRLATWPGSSRTVP